jgi:septal ring factor EnvC (AmiA/AmiB activator)
MIVEVMKNFEADQQDNVQQADIINKMIQKLELENMEVSTSIEQSIETSKKISNVIQHLIKSENVLMVSQDSKIKNERYLCLSVGVEHTFQNMSLGSKK